jgi:hypothetical protein
MITKKRHWALGLLDVSPLQETDDAGLALHLEKLGTAPSLALSLPNASLCADFLFSPSLDGVVGIAIAVSNDDAANVRALFAGCDKRRVQWSFAATGVPARFANYGEWNWLEVTWAQFDDAELIETQSIGVVWHTSKAKRFGEICAVSLEDVDYLEKECGARFFDPRRAT